MSTRMGERRSRVVKLWYKYFDSLTHRSPGQIPANLHSIPVCGMTYRREEEAVIAKAGAKCFYDTPIDEPQESALIRWGSDFAPALANTK